MGAMIQLSGVRAGYGAFDVLNGVDLTVETGTMSCIVGANGAGKSTVLKTMSGLLRARSGSIVVDGTELVGLSPEQILRAGVVQVPQRFGLFGRLTVRQNVLMGGYVVRRDGKALNARYDEVAAMFPIVADRGDQRAASLSGGQRRLVEFARAMMLRPKVVLLDEPTLGLDPRSQSLIRQHTLDMQATGVTVLMVEQNVRYGLALSERGTVMTAGRVVLEGPSADIAQHPHLMSYFFGLDPQATA